LTRADAACAAAFGLALVISVSTAFRNFPDPALYHMVADEGAYYFQASTIRIEGLRGFRKLADQYVADPVQQGLPAPNRVGHIVLASIALRASDSMRALSVLSLACFAATAILIFAFAWTHWNPLTAAVAGVLAAFSPLGVGLSRRALMDTDYALFTVLALVLCVRWMTTARGSALVAFASALFAALMVKETVWLFMPFFVITPIVAGLAAGRRVPFAHIALIACGVPLAAIGVSMALLGPGRFVEIVRVSAQLNAVTPNPYLVAYGSGPWYEYLISLLLLSPIVGLLFLLFAGAYAGRGEWHAPTTVVLTFFAYALAALALLPKNPRLILPLDVAVRIGAAAAIVWAVRRAHAFGRPFALAVGGALMGAAIVSDAASFERYFARLDVYDPVTFALLQREHMAPPSANWGTEKLADEYVELSLAFSQVRDFAGAIRAGRSALLWRPNDAMAYRTIGAAYCEMQQWRDAVQALEAALRIDPASPGAAGARANLARARVALASSKSP
jgi:hypothetical protein